MKEKSVSFPVRMPSAMHDQIKSICDSTGMTQQDVIRLAIQIGIVDLTSVQVDLAEMVHKAAKDKGLSFSQWAARGIASQQGKPQAPSVKPGQQDTSTNVVIAHSLMPITTARERAIAAEEAAPYQAKKTKTFSPGQRPA